MTPGKLSLIHGNALSLPLADRSVHLVVSSPPYFTVRDYQDADGSLDGQIGSEATPHHFLAALWAVLDECWRVLRDDGSCWINLGDKFAGSGGHNNAGVSMNRGVRECIECGWQGERFQCVVCGADVRHPSKVTASRRTAPDRYNQDTGGLRPKSRMLLPHRFALGLIDPEYRQWVEQRITPRCAYCNGYEDAAYCTCGRSGLTVQPPQWICRMDAVWSKANGLPESMKDRVRASHEYWFHLAKSERYYAATDEIREPHLMTSWSAKADLNGSSLKSRGELPSQNTMIPAPESTRVRHEQRKTFVSYDPLGKLPGSVWEVATEPLTLPPDLPQHFAAFPSWFPRRIIAGWSPSGVCTVCGEGRRPVSERGASFPLEAIAHRLIGYACACPTPTAPTTPARILDPFSGTGTTAIVAAALGRHGIGVDLSWDYHRIARWRDADGGLRAKALEVARPAREVDGQLGLFA